MLGVQLSSNIWDSLKKMFLFVCVWAFSSLHVCTPNMSPMPTRPGDGMDPLEQELQTAGWMLGIGSESSIRAGSALTC